MTETTETRAHDPSRGRHADDRRSADRVATFCRICEPSCGLIAHVEHGELVKLTPDRDHPASQGFACHKGLAAVDLHRDPDRLDHPLVRSPDGSWRPTSWDDAIEQVTARLRSIIAHHGIRAVGAYTGNPMAFNALATTQVPAGIRAMGITRTFSSGTQDCANKFAAGHAVFGTTTVHTIPDLEHTDLCLVIGANPRASQGSFWSLPNILGEMRRCTARGGRVVFVNPRRIERLERGIGDTIQIRPDTDVWFLAALLGAIDDLGGFDEAIVERHGRNLDGLRSFIAEYTPERTEAVTGIPARTVRELAEAWTNTPRASVHASTGINMGRHGTLTYWLVNMLSFVTGRLDVEGGNLKSDGFYPNARSGASEFALAYGETEFGVLRRGNLPGTLMSDAILDSDEPIRAMIVVAGNPLLSIGGEDRLRKAFEQLELLVVLDIYPTATAELADVVLPCTDMYERDDINVVNLGTSARPYVQYTPAVVTPIADRRPEWWIVQRLAAALGSEQMAAGVDPWGKWRHMLSVGSGVDLDQLMASDEPVVLEPPRPGTFYDKQVQTPDGRVDCCPEGFTDAFERCAQAFAKLATPGPSERLLLIHRRDQWMHNSWFANLERMKRGGRTTNPLGIHPTDASRLGIADASSVLVSSEHGAIEATASLDDDLMPGVVSMVHGWGHAASPRLTVAHRHPGSNPNALLPTGPDSFEPLSSQAHMTGIAVTVRPAGGNG